MVEDEVRRWERQILVKLLLVPPEPGEPLDAYDTRADAELRLLAGSRGRRGSWTAEW